MDYEKMFEVAGMQEHYKKEKKVFEDTMMGLRKFMNYVENYDNGDYKDLYIHAEELLDEMREHLKRYRK